MIQHIKEIIVRKDQIKLKIHFNGSKINKEKIQNIF